MKVLQLVESMLGQVKIKIRTREYPEDCSVRFNYRGDVLHAMNYRAILANLYVESIDTDEENNVIIYCTFTDWYAE